MHGKQFKDAALIVASPPCQEFSYMAMPWSKAKAKERDLLEGRDDPKRLTALFDACFRIQREAIEAAGHFIPLVVENVRGAQKWVGRSRWNYGSFHLWGDVPALMPMTKSLKLKTTGPVTQAQADQHNCHINEMRDAFKTVGHTNKRDGHSRTRHLTNQRESDGPKCPGIKLSQVGFNVATAQRYRAEQGDKNGGDWFGSGENCSEQRKHGSKSDSRKAASAAIAKIPMPLAQHIARYWKPQEVRAT
jgi:hypothetical protein